MRQLKISNRITSRESFSLDKYLSEIGKIEMLTPDEEIALAKRIRTGDNDALERMIECNLRFVVSVAKQYQNNGIQLSDLINEGNVGLIKAAHRFDETKGFKFISYAVWWIRQSILQAIIDYSRIVRLPMNKVSSYNRVNDAFSSFVQEFEREPEPGELAELLNVPEKEITLILKSSIRHTSMDSPLSEDDDSGTLLDTLTSDDDSPETKLLLESLTEEVNQGLSVLSDREVDVIAAYFGLKGIGRGMSLEEISELYDLTKERCRQIKERALRRLRKVYNYRDLRTYLS